MFARTHFGRSRFVALGAVVVVLGGVACNAAGAFVQPAPTTAPAALQRAADGVARSAAVPAPAAGGVAVAVSAAAPGQPLNAAVAPQGAESNAPDTSAQMLNRMVIRTAQLSVEVQDIEQALAQVRAVASRGGGFVSASNTHFEKVNDQDRMVADLTLQVRSDVVDNAMSDLRALGKVTNENSGSQDVTEEYVDLDSNLRNLQASETAILKLMDKATQIQDVLTLQRELTNVRGQIERIQGRKTYLERRTDMATISISLRLPPAPSAQSTTGGWDPLGVAQRGWQASLTLLRGVAEAVIIVLAFSWWLVPFVALGVYVWLQRRRTPPTVTPTAPGTV
jgi:hypothetical protein